MKRRPCDEKNGELEINSEVLRGAGYPRCSKGLCSKTQEAGEMSQIGGRRG